MKARLTRLFYSLAALAALAAASVPPAGGTDRHRPGAALRAVRLGAARNWGYADPGHRIPH
jgi:hypothetical protein